MCLMRIVGCLLLGVAAAARGAAPPLPRADLLGDPLPPGAIARLGTLRLRQQNFPQAVALTRDGSRATAVDASGKAVYLWELPSGKGRALSKGHADELRCVAISPDGRTVASGDSSSRTGTVWLWDTRSGKLLHTLAVPNGVLRVAFAPDGRTLAVSNEKIGLSLWDRSKGAKVREIKDKSCLGGIAFSPDGKTLASSREGGAIVLWDAGTGREKWELLGHERAAEGLAFSPDGKKLASGAPDRTIRIWDVMARKEARRLAVEQVWYQNLRFTDAGALLGLSAPHRLTRWDLASGKASTVWEDGQKLIIGTIDFTPDGRTAVFGSSNGPDMLRRLDLVAKKEVILADGHTCYVGDIVFTPDGKSILTSAWLRGDPVVRLWDPLTGRLRREFKGHTGGAKTLAVSSDGDILASSEWMSHEVRLWDLRAGILLRKLEGHTGTPTSIAFSPDGTTLASGDSHSGKDGHQVGRARLWDVRTGKLLRTLPEGKWDCGVVFTSDGRTLVTRGDATIHWDIASGKRTRFSETYHDFPFSRDGRFAANFGLKKFGIREILTGKPLYETVGRMGAAISVDGGMFATIDESTVIRFWDTLDGSPVGKIEGPAGVEVRSLAFSPDGKMLASGHGDTTALIWDLRALRIGLPMAPTRTNLAQAWSHLANADPAPAYRAVRSLTHDPTRAALYIGRRLLPASSEEGKDIARWIADLDAPAYGAREAGSAALAKVGRRSEPALRAALKATPSAEQRQRIQRLLEHLERVRYSDDELRAFRAVAALERINNDEARRVLKLLAGGNPASSLTQDAAASLARIVSKPALNR